MASPSRLPHLLALLLVVGACDRPTAPELLTATDRMGRDLSVDGALTPPDQLWWRTGAGFVTYSLPEMGALEVSVDGHLRRYTAFVMERADPRRP